MEGYEGTRKKQNVNAWMRKHRNGIVWLCSVFRSAFIFHRLNNCFVRTWDHVLLMIRCFKSNNWSAHRKDKTKTDSCLFASIADTEIEFIQTKYISVTKLSCQTFKQGEWETKNLSQSDCIVLFVCVKSFWLCVRVVLVAMMFVKRQLDPVTTQRKAQRWWTMTTGRMEKSERVRARA